MKTFVLILSKKFPSYHTWSRKETDFERSFINAQMCAKCRENPDKGRCMCNFIFGYRKKHTIRGNYEMWAKRFIEIEKGEAQLSIRQWEGRPYHSKQKTLANLTKEDGIGIEKMVVVGSTLYNPIFVGDKSVTCNTIAHNDGLSEGDWRDWFERGNPLGTTFAVIHFTTFRYSNEKD